MRTELSSSDQVLLAIRPRLLKLSGACKRTIPLAYRKILILSKVQCRRR